MLTQSVIGQIEGDKEIRGKISVDSSSIEGINVMNSSNEKTAISDKNGMFSLLAKEGDFLVFSAVNMETFRNKINNHDLISDVIQVQMTPKRIVLKEVIINQYPNITAENLRIIPYGQKKYTPAERKLYAASGGILGLMNIVSGCKEMLKKELEVEKKEQLLTKIDLLFEDKYYLKTLKIPVDYIRGFQYYCIEDMNFAATLKSKNKTMAMFLIIPLAEKYNQIIEK